MTKVFQTSLVLLVAAALVLGCEPKKEEAKGNDEGEKAKTESPEGAEANAGTPEATSDETAAEGTEAGAATDGAAGEPAAAGDAPETAAADGAEAPAAPENGEACNDKSMERLADGQTCHFGAPFALESEPAALAEIWAGVAKTLETDVKVTGTVKMACRKKGCWMEMEPPEGADPVRVTFKDYGFFVPKYADGAAATLEGQFVADTITEGMRKHLAEDAGQPPEEIEKITGDTDVVKFVATAVELTAPKAAP